MKNRLAWRRDHATELPDVQGGKLFCPGKFCDTLPLCLKFFPLFK